MREKRLKELKEKNNNFIKTKGLTGTNIQELINIAEAYENALKEIYKKGNYIIRGNIANELAEIARKTLSE